MYNCSGTRNAPYVNIKEGPLNRKRCPNNIVLSVSPGHREAAENGGTVMIAATSCELEAKR